MTLSYSRALYLEFFFDQTMENFLRGHVHAFQSWKGQPRAILYDNLKAAVLERRGSQILFNPRLLELSAHYHFAPQPCQVRAGNQKGRVDRLLHGIQTDAVGGAIDRSPLESAARHPHRRARVVMVAPLALLPTARSSNPAGRGA